MSTHPPGTSREDRIRAGAQRAAELALLEVKLDDIETSIFAHTSTPPTITELRQAMAMVHHATVELCLPEPSTMPRELAAADVDPES